MKLLLLALLPLVAVPASAGVVGTFGDFPSRPNYQLVFSPDSTWAMNAEVMLLTCCGGMDVDSLTWDGLPCKDERMTMDFNVQIRGRWSSQDQANLGYQEAYFDTLYGGFYPLRVQGLVRWAYVPNDSVRLADTGAEPDSVFETESVWGKWSYSAVRHIDDPPSVKPCSGGRIRSFRLWR